MGLDEGDQVAVGILDRGEGRHDIAGGDIDAQAAGR